MRTRTLYSSMPPVRPWRLGAVAVLLVSLVSVEAAAAASRKARGLYSRGVAAEAAGDFDKALELYSLAGQESPGDSRFTLAERRMRFVAGQAHVSAGLDLRQQGLLEEALTEFEQAFAIDPASSVAAQERRRTIELIERRDALAGAGEAPPTVQQSALEEARFDRAQMVGSITEPADLVPLSAEPINLMLKEQSKIVFETIGKLAGINVLFDPDFSDSEVEIEIRNATLPEALDYVGLLAKAFWKPVTHNTVMVANDNPNKRREFEDEVIKTVYLTNLSTQQDLAEVSTAIRGVTDLRRLFTVASMNALVIRGSRSKVAIAEKIVHDMDKPRPEVIVDVLVLETSKSSERTLGLFPVSGGGKGFQFPISFTGSGSGADSAGIALSRFGDIGLGSWATTLPGFQLTALFKSSDTELLQSPRVRTADNHQADLRIGDRIPIATGSFQPGVGGVGINPLVNTQFTYTDVGVNVSMTPKIHANREVSMHVEVEISNVREFIVIGQRTIQHDVRVQEGEASVIGGLNQSQLFKTKAGVPFLGEIPVIGKLFSEEEVKRADSEILLVLIPHIVRMPGIEQSNLRTIASGTDQKFEVRYEQQGNGQPALGVDPGDPAAVRSEQAPAPDPAVAPQPEPEPAEAQPGDDTGQPTPAPATDEPQPDRPEDPDAAEVPAPQGPLLSLEPEMAVIPVDQRITLSVVVGDAVELASMPLRIQYDREKLRLVGIERGPFLAGDDASDIIFSRSIRHANGLAAVNISRFPGAGGADGDGVLVTLTFEGLAPGTAQLRVTANSPRDASNRTLDVQPLETEISVE